MTDRPLEGRHVAVVVADLGTDHGLLLALCEAVAGAGGDPVLLGPRRGGLRTVRGLTVGPSVDAEHLVADVRPEDFDGLVVPGGLVGVDRLRSCHEAVDLVRGCVRTGHPLAVAGHAAWLVVEADVARGRTLTGAASVATDVRNAGGTWLDRPVVACDDGPGPIVSLRGPDLPVDGGVDLSAGAATLTDDVRIAVVQGLAAGHQHVTPWAP